ncbi:hypothetical protein [Microbacterium sp.]|uniref:hypothetical protein n=1 Tax=Microbacterium sp. TaxID=51671 RepID=UPI0037C97413
MIEAKTGATANVIWKDDATVIPLVIRPSHVVGRACTPPPDCRSINRANMKEHKKA